MILGAAFCPYPPAIVPEVAGAAAVELADLRSACTAAISQVFARGGQPVLLGAGAQSASHSPVCRGSLAGLGVAMEVHLGSPSCGGQLDLPLSLTIGAWLVRESVGPTSAARAFSIGPDFASSRASVELLGLAESEDIALLVMGDGSARRSTSAPGYLDERAAGFDASVVSALEHGDAVALEALDADLGDQLLVAGVPAWHVAGGLMDATPYDARVLYDDAPYGVGYFVSAWTARA